MKILPSILAISVIFILPSYGSTDKTFAITPFIDLSYDLGEGYQDYYQGGYLIQESDGINYSIGVCFYRNPLYLQIQASNLLYGSINAEGIYGIIGVGLIDNVIKNGFVELNLSYTDNLKGSSNNLAYSGSIGYNHLFHFFSGGIYFGFSIRKNEIWKEEYRHNLFTIAEFVSNTKCLKPYLSLGLSHPLNSNSSEKFLGFLSVGFQAQFELFGKTTPFVSGNQIKLTYYKKKETAWMVRKPNIYLYPESKIQAKVTLIPQKGNEITSSIPDYKNGWNVSVEPSGVIDGKYEYLFYEGNQKKYNPSRVGWSISHDELWQFFPKIMEEYGFNKKEINDFVDYWEKHIPKSQFYDITLVTTQEVEKEFALVIDPKPDTVLRLWFCIIPQNKKGNLPSPKITEFKRKGFTVTEWGVVLK